MLFGRQLTETQHSSVGYSLDLRLSITPFIAHHSVHQSTIIAIARRINNVVCGKFIVLSLLLLCLAP